MINSDHHCITYTLTGRCTLEMPMIKDWLMPVEIIGGKVEHVELVLHLDTPLIEKAHDREYITFDHGQSTDQIALDTSGSNELPATESRIPEYIRTALIWASAAFDCNIVVVLNGEDIRLYLDEFEGPQDPEKLVPELAGHIKAAKAAAMQAGT